MELHFGMIRDRDAIYSGLVESRSLHRQLAICYNSKGKLLVKICTVEGIGSGRNGTTVTLVTNGTDGIAETITVALDDIKSIYLMNSFS